VDYVAAANLTPQGGVILVVDRLGNSQGSFQTPSNSYAQAPSSLYFASGSFSMTMWLQNQNSGTQKPLFEFANGPGVDTVGLTSVTPSGGTCNPSPSYLELRNTGGSYSLACSSASFTNGAWYHLAVVLNQTSLTSYIYVNGALASTTGSQLAIPNVTRANNYFGNSAYNNYGNWMFDEIKIHGRALTAQEVLSDFNKNQTYLTFV
jgi:hypothetical protein